MAKEMGRKVLDEDAFEEAQAEIEKAPSSAMGPKVLKDSPDEVVTQANVESKPPDLNHPIGPIFEETGVNQMGPHYAEAAPHAPLGAMKKDDITKLLKENPAAADAVLVAELDRAEGPRVTVLRLLLATEKKQDEPREEFIDQVEALISIATGESEPEDEET